MESYRELIVWQNGMDLVVGIYPLTATFPKQAQANEIAHANCVAAKT